MASDLIHDAILEHNPESCGFSASNCLHASYVIHESDTLLNRGYMEDSPELHTDVPHTKVLQLLQAWKLWASVYPTIAPIRAVADLTKESLGLGMGVFKKRN